MSPFTYIEENAIVPNHLGGVGRQQKPVDH